MIVSVLLLSLTYSLAEISTDTDAYWKRLREVRAQNLVEFHCANIEKTHSEYMNARWRFDTNVTAFNAQVASEKRAVRSQAFYAASEDLRQFVGGQYVNHSLRRAVRMLVQNEGDVTAEDVSRAGVLQSEMGTTYSTASVNTRCPDTDDDTCQLNIMAVREAMMTTTDWDDLVTLWRGWRDSAAKPNRRRYSEFVTITNRMARAIGATDHTQLMLSPYEVDDMEEQVDTLWHQLEPLYRKLHGYVRRKLRLLYEHDGRTFPASGHIPAHLLGELMGAQWRRSGDLLPSTTPINFGDRLVQRNYTGKQMYQLAENFFVSLGLPRVPQTFWENSLFEEPRDGRRVRCHPEAWDFLYNGEVRMKHCVTLDEHSFATAHHELGHIYYFMAYRHQLTPFRTGANPGFHEAVGDAVGLSANTPQYLRDIGLIDEVPENEETDINFLLKQAFVKVAMLPFSYILDKWRYSVYRGQTAPEDYNAAWWRLRVSCVLIRCRHQGLSPPVPRSEDDFDPAAVYHVPANMPYLRYFVGYILQYQIHESLCSASGHTGPLHKCNIYNSTQAGRKLWTLLEMGSSKPWSEAMEALTGSRHLNASALVTYFEPLSNWLDQQPSDNSTWTDECPTGYIIAQSSPSMSAIHSGCWSLLSVTAEMIYLVIFTGLLIRFFNQ